MKPEILVLDEPTAGLDPAGRTELLDMIAELKEKEGMTIVLVSHSMDDVAEVADRIIVMDKGKIVFDDIPTEVFKHVSELETMGLAAPEMSYVLRDLKAAGIPVNEGAITLKETKEEILRVLS